MSDKAFNIDHHLFILVTFTRSVQVRIEFSHHYDVL